MQAIPTTSILPADLADALLVGRAWRGAPIDGPCVIVVRGGQVFDISASAPTVSELLDRPDAAAFARSAPGVALGPVDGLIAAALSAAPPAGAPALLAPCDLQAIKACGVTFAVSMVERVIEEQAGGDASRAHEIRADLQTRIGTNLAEIRPGSEQALQLKEHLVSRGAWSPYLEVGIGPYAEVFSKSQPMSSLGLGADLGLHPESHWNNPEPEVVLAVNSRGEIVGATLGNDVNLRDIEGRSALLLGKAKDNNGSCSIGPFIRLFDTGFTLDTVRAAKVRLRVEGEDGFELDGVSNMVEISRDPLELVDHTYGANHQYPDGFMLFLGTMFSPTKDRGAPGAGFTHHMGDRVTISTDSLGALVNHMQRSNTITPWTFGTRALMANLARRGLLGATATEKSA